jgi:5-methylcytosine-specific restriction endonuclease McrA
MLFFCQLLDRTQMRCSGSPSLGRKRGAGAAAPAGARDVLAPIPFPPSPGRMETRSSSGIVFSPPIRYTCHKLNFMLRTAMPEDGMVVASDLERGAMYISLPILLLLVIVLVIAGVVLMLTTRKRSHRRKGLFKQLGQLLKALDQGAHIAKKHGHERSSHWGSVAKEHLRHEPACVVCGYKGRKRQVHHIKPFHLHPDLELDPHNLITLCSARGKEHHLLLGHLGAWDSYNEHIRTDAKHFHLKSAAQIKADLHWQKKMSGRP